MTTLTQTHNYEAMAQAVIKHLSELKPDIQIDATLTSEGSEQLYLWWPFRSNPKDGLTLKRFFNNALFPVKPNFADQVSLNRQLKALPFEFACEGDLETLLRNLQGDLEKGVLLERCKVFWCGVSCRVSGMVWFTLFDDQPTVGDMLDATTLKHIEEMGEQA